MMKILNERVQIEVGWPFPGMKLRLPGNRSGQKTWGQPVFERASGINAGNSNPSDGLENTKTPERGGSRDLPELKYDHASKLKEHPPRPASDCPVWSKGRQ